jgi:hypothetical protein
LFATAFLAASATAGPAADPPALLQEAVLAPLPLAVSNNAVASVKAGRRDYVVSFNGLAEGKTHADTLASTYVYDSRSKSWSEADPVPGDAGRLASAAASADGRVYVFGGYTIDKDGAEVSTPWTHAFDPRKETSTSCSDTTREMTPGCRRHRYPVHLCSATLVASSEIRSFIATA